MSTSWADGGHGGEVEEVLTQISIYTNSCVEESLGRRFGSGFKVHLPWTLNSYVAKKIISCHHIQHHIIISTMASLLDPATTAS